MSLPDEACRFDFSAHPSAMWYIEFRENMNLNEFLLLDERHTLSPDEAQELNLALSTKAMSDIPEEHRVRVADYLAVALNMGSVEPGLIRSIEGLLQDLQQDR